MTVTQWRKGCDSPVVKVSDQGRHVMSSSPEPLKTRRVGQRCTLNLSRAETSSRWCDLELEVKEDDIEELIMGHEDELTIEELQEILNEEHQETQQNVSPSEQEEDEKEDQC
ncbi:hypothetical protein TNCV_3454501 [Trichonephila clavipes]|nr:hypothetical protein TNCV_3454501 [Trichonephila clavipes]